MDTVYVVRLLNTVPALLLRSPLHRLLSRGVVLLTFTGRKSGRSFTTPINYVQDDQTLLMTTDSPWWRNLRGGAPVSVRLDGRTLDGQADVSTEPADVVEALSTLMARFPSYGRYAHVRRGADGQPIAEDMLRAAREGRAVVRVRLAQAAA